MRASHASIVAAAVLLGAVLGLGTAITYARGWAHLTHDARVHELQLGSEAFVAAMPVADAPADGMPVSLADIARHGLVWFPEQQIPALRARLLSAFRSAGHEVHVVQDANRTLTVLACVAAGLGWSLLPGSVRALQHEGVRFAEVQEVDVLPRFELSALWRMRSRPGFADLFAQMLLA